MYTWNNVQYANSAGILNNMTANDKAAAEGRQQIVDSISGFGEDYSKSQTDAFNAAVNTASSKEEIDSLVANRDNSWLDMESVNVNALAQQGELRTIANQEDTFANNTLTRQINERKIKKMDMDADLSQKFRDRLKTGYEPIVSTNGTGEPSANVYANTPGVSSGAYDFNAETDLLASQIGQKSNALNDYGKQRSDIVGKITAGVIEQGNSMAPGADRDAYFASRKADVNDSDYSSKYKTEVKTQLDDAIKATRKNEADLKVIETGQQYDALKQDVLDIGSGQDPVATAANIFGLNTADIAAKTNLTPTQINEVTEPLVAEAEFNKIRDLFTNDTNLAVIDKETGILVPTKAGIARYGQEVEALVARRPYWKNHTQFEARLKAELNIDSMTKKMAATTATNIADIKDKTDRFNANAEKLTKFKNETYTAGKTFSKLEGVHPSKISKLVDEIKNVDAYFQDNEWILYKAIQTVGRVDEDALSRDDIDVPSTDTNWFKDQSVEDTHASVYAEATRLRKQYTRSETFKTSAGKEYPSSLLVMDDAAKSARLTTESAINAKMKEAARLSTKPPRRAGKLEKASTFFLTPGQATTNNINNMIEKLKR